MPTEYFTQIIIKINGQDIPIELMDLLDETVVDTSLHLPDMFTLQFQDPHFEWIDSDLFDIGNSVDIKIKTGQEQGEWEEFLIKKGEITAIEPNFSAGGDTSILVRGYSKSHRLHRGRKTRTFLNQTDADIVKKVAGEAGLSTDIDPTNIAYDFVMQNNQTNMEFLLARAERIGYQVYVIEGKLYFKKGETSQGDGPELKLGETLNYFRPTLTSSHQADKIVVKGWDAKGKKEIVSEAAPNGSLNQGGMKKTGGDEAAAAFGSAEAVVTDHPVFSVDEANALAKGLGNDINREYIQAEGECDLGDPRIKAGWTVTISNVGARFKGKYFVTSATHLYSRGGYKTNFSISGRQPNTISHLLEQKNGSGQAQGLVQGVVTGLVTNLNDPENLGRVKVKYGWLGEIESDWTRIASPMGGAGRGFFYLPEINDEVLLAFQQGHIHHPYIIGVLWNSKDKPPKPNSEVTSGGVVNQRILKSRSGHVIILDDTDGAEQIKICDKTGKNQIVIDSKTNTMTINLEKDYILDNKGNVDSTSVGNVTIDSKGNITIKSTGNTEIKSTGNLDLQATGVLNIKGNKVSIDGGPMTEVKGAMVSVSGSALTEVKGGLVKIN